MDDDLLASLVPARVLARGPKAAGAAMTAGLDVWWQTPTARASELVDKLTEIADRRRAEGNPTALRVAVQLDGAPGQPLADRIAELGFDTVRVPIYEWHLPKDCVPAERLLNQVANRSIDAVTFTAAHAVNNFFDLAAGADLVDAVVAGFNSGDVAAVCVGPVCADQAKAHGIERVVVPRHARLGAMVQSCVAAFIDRGQEFALGGHAVRMQGRLVAVDGADPVQLSDREREVLRVLARKPSAVVAKPALLREVWGGTESDEHLVEVTVARLRQRLGPAGSAVETVVRRGYRLAPD